jgi:cytochrome c oxidase subunit 3
MTTSSAVMGESSLSETSLAEYKQKTVTNRMGLWMFILSDTFMFLGLFISRFYLLGTAIRPDINQILGLVVTSILLVSSFFMNRAETAMAYGDMKEFSRSILITIVLGMLFLIGVLGVEWQIAPGGPADGAIWSLFYTMTGFHAFHVLTGVIFLVIVYRNARKGLYSTERHFPIEAAAVYWHFIDVVWIFFYTALYLIGKPPLF